jgi:murein DD-endopeptidase MepM/ murein hydrolase activator NlpD
MSAKKFYRFLNKNLNYSLLIVPNSSSTKVKSCYIPYSLALLIIGFIFFNLYIFFGYSIQIWQIADFKKDISSKKILISKLTAERQIIRPILAKSELINKELSKLQESQSTMDNTLTRVREKKGRSIFIASRGFFVRTQPYSLSSLPKSDAPNTSLDQLSHNLRELDHYIEAEKQEQEKILNELRSYEYHLDHMPSIWPINTSIVCYFGMRLHPIYKRYILHEGLDIEASYGAPIRATADGVVTYAGWESGYGNLIKISHGNGYETRYGHNSHILVHVGQTIKKGQKIALAGATGDTTGPHCHYEVRDHGTPINPVPYLKVQ